MVYTEKFYIFDRVLDIYLLILLSDIEFAVFSSSRRANNTRQRVLITLKATIYFLTRLNNY